MKKKKRNTPKNTRRIDVDAIARRHRRLMAEAAVRIPNIFDSTHESDNRSMTGRVRLQHKSPKARLSTLVCFILDESGSMRPHRQEVIDGFNEFLEDRRKDPGKVLASLTKFDSTVKTAFSGVDISEVHPLDAAGYAPGSGTALFDAVGHAVSAVEKVASHVDRVLCVIFTDGQENSSRRYSREAVDTLIRTLQAAGKWTFVYFGANHDAWAAGGAIGIPAANIVPFDANRTRGAMQMASVLTEHYMRHGNLRQGVESPAARPAAIEHRKQEQLSFSLTRGSKRKPSTGKNQPETKHKTAKGGK